MLSSQYRILFKNISEDKIMKTIKKILYIVVASITIPAGIVYAQRPSGSADSDGFFPTPIGPQDFKILVHSILGVVIKVGTVVAVLAIIYSGYLFIAAQGKEEKLKTAKDTFLWVVIGSIILLGAEVLSRVIYDTMAPIVGPF